ncbi:DMSO/selenate family reductase complex A subunit [Ferrimonas sp. SCSIO 43195]|uniref:DMSO/selenate family reductase complex A subunit n=1 Tax=Ferrimonas sp. SCSIO 43195 TaxID=2822844 RepID=UPI002075881E|nr:DMSO/selenate family reductase complex A subunit [Ferrimonas sp. SCSIO 43195]USD35692.1 molybdopterin-dependent oxidoreductase [Ferrimonas sp. SCSIO 43195]
MERREFLKMSAAMSAAAAVTGCSSESAQTTPPVTVPVEEKLNWSACLVNCGSNCPVKVYSRDGIITRIETDYAVEDDYGNHQVRACLRGRSLRKRVYAPDRLKYPMKRVGPRGSGQFERISWDEALNTVASELGRLRGQYGPECTHFTYHSGAYYSFAGFNCLARLMNITGGALGAYGDYSWAQLYQAANYTYGDANHGWLGSSNAEMRKSDLVLLIGHNPAEMRMSGSGESYDYLNIIQDKQKQRAQDGTQFKTIIIDPRYTDSALGKEDQWIPVRPGTDAALMEALAFELITNNWIDQSFLNSHCLGFDEHTLPAGQDYDATYKSYILDNTQPGSLTAGSNAKTPEWASAICGVPADDIRQLAKDLADATTPFVHIAASLNRQAAGENNIRACYMLPILLGQVGLPGTNNGAMCSGASLPIATMPTRGDLNTVDKSISFFTFTQAIEDGENMTVLRDGVKLPADQLDANGDGKLGVNIKAIVNYAGNALINQHADTKKTEALLKDESKCEFIVVIDNWMTPSAEFADILLPDINWLETKDDLINQSYAAGDTATLVQMSSSLEPMFECRDAYDIALGIAEIWGVAGQFTEGKTKQQWRDELYAVAKNATPELPSKEEMKTQGIFRKYLPNGSYVVLEDFRKDPVANPLKTPSGKIEIYSDRLATLGSKWELKEGDVISALPKYVPTWDGYESLDTPEEREKAAKYPLQMHGYHTKGRAHSSYHNVPWLREAVEDAVWMNPIDAQERGLSSGDTVQVFNDRGTIELPVKVTPRIMPGVTALGQGAWFKGAGKTIDKGGCLNTLTSQRPTPISKGNGQHTIRVQINKA